MVAATAPAVPVAISPIGTQHNWKHFEGTKSAYNITTSRKMNLQEVRTMPIYETWGLLRHHPSTDLGLWFFSVPQ